MTCAMDTSHEFWLLAQATNSTSVLSAAFRSEQGRGQVRQYGSSVDTKIECQ